MRHRLVGLNSGRWNYIASILRTYHKDPTSQIVAREKITKDLKFIKSFRKHIVHIAHKRGAHAIAGVNNHIPQIKDKKSIELAKKELIKEKIGEAKEGFDGSWVAHPLLVETARKSFDVVIRNSFN